MFSLFSQKKSLSESGLFKGAVDNHCHILFGVDDGISRKEDSLKTLQAMEQEGIEEVWFTPHIMEDVPNTTEGLKARFAELCSEYNGSLKLHLAAEYMMDPLFKERLRAGDILTHGGNKVLIETSTFQAPADFKEILWEIISKGYKPILAHPERYLFIDGEKGYRELIDMGVTLQLNYPSLLGFYGSHVRKRAEMLLGKGMYTIAGSDCHRYRVFMQAKELKELGKKTVEALSELMKSGKDQ